MFYNLDIALKMYLTIIPSNTTGERFFSILKRIKNYLMQFSFRYKGIPFGINQLKFRLLESMDFNSLINTFVVTKLRMRQI